MCYIFSSMLDACCPFSVLSLKSGGITGFGNACSLTVSR